MVSLAALDTKAGPSIWDQQLLVNTSNFLYIYLQFSIELLQNSDQDQQLFNLVLTVVCSRVQRVDKILKLHLHVYIYEDNISKWEYT